MNKKKKDKMLILLSVAMTAMIFSLFIPMATATTYQDYQYWDRARVRRWGVLFGELYGKVNYRRYTDISSQWIGEDYSEYFVTNNYNVDFLWISQGDADCIVDRDGLGNIVQLIYVCYGTYAKRNDYSKNVEIVSTQIVRHTNNNDYSIEKDWNGLSTLWWDVYKSDGLITL